MSHGVLVVDKPRGPTSHDVVARARRVYGTRSVGHAGTLDPMATGVLLVLVGEATKLAPYLHADDKRYVAEVTLGVGTDTDDADGQVTETLTPDAWPESAALELALAVERGRTEQLPPTFSAIQVGGVRAHRAARRGEPLDLPPRPVAVRGLRVLDWSPPRTTLELEVSRGYYVRALARDLGRSLGLPAHLTSLRRVASGPFTIESAAAWPPEGAPPPLLSLMDSARLAVGLTRLTEAGAFRARRGQRLSAEHFAEVPPSGVAGWVDERDQLLAVGSWQDGVGQVVRGFNAVAPPLSPP